MAHPLYHREGLVSAIGLLGYHLQRWYTGLFPSEMTEAKVWAR